nr:tRNA-dependent cyclodipeptide synthase [Cytophagales bacterium]
MDLNSQRARSGMLKASFKNSAIHLAEYDTFILGISMNTTSHSGQALGKIVELINSREHKKDIINVGDALYRFTYMAQGMSEEEATAEALKLGDDWIAQNISILEGLESDWKILRWSSFLEDPRFNGYYDQFAKAYEESDLLRSAIARDIRGFYARTRGSEYRPTDLEIECSTRFFIEELAVYAIQFEDYPSAQIYAGRELESSKLARLGRIPNVPQGTQNCRFFRVNIYDVPANENVPQ